MDNANKPAFPYLGTVTENTNPGLTKREYLAALIIQGLCANPEFYKIASKKLGPDDIGDFYSLCAAEQADSLLKRLEENNIS